MFARNPGLVRADPTVADPHYGATVLLLGFENEGTDDSPQKSTITARNSSSLSSTTYVKFGTYSGFCAQDAPGGAAQPYFSVSNTSTFQMNTQDWTWESWVYVPSWNQVGNFDVFSWNVFINESTYKPIAVLFSRDSPSQSYKLAMYDFNTFSQQSTYSITSGAWHHLAVSKSGGKWYFGQDGSVTNVTPASQRSIDANHCTDIRIRDSGYHQGNFNVYFDEMRVTKGVARYTAAYTTPTTRFPRM